MIQGQLVAVQRVPAGVEVLADAPVAATEVMVLLALDLADTGGALLMLPGGDVATVDSADHESGVVVLAEPLPVALSAGDWLTVPGVVEVVATVDMGDGVVDVTVPHALRALLPDRFEELEGGLSVLLDVDPSGALSLVDVLDAPPVETWGDPDGPHSELSAAGLRVYKMGPGGVPYVATALTSAETAVSVVDPEGTVLGGISSEGNLSGRRGSLESLRVQGMDLLGALGGGLTPGWLDRLPRGVLNVNSSPGSDSPAATGVEGRNIAVSAMLLPGRRYRIVGSMAPWAGVIDGVVRLKIRRTTDGTYPTLSSPELGNGWVTGKAYTGSVSIAGRAEAFFTVPAPTVASFLLTYQGLNGAMPNWRRSVIWIEDVGPAAVEIEAPEDAPPKVAITSTWRASASRRYYKDGSPVPGGDGEVATWSWRGSPPDFQSTAIIFGGGASDSTDPNEVGKSLDDARTGATVTRARVYLRNKSFYADETGELGLSKLNGSTLPASMIANADQHTGPLDAGAGAWMDVPTSWFAVGNVGVALGDSDGSFLDGSGGSVPLLPAVFHGVSDEEPPLLQLDYTR